MKLSHLKSVAVAVAATAFIGSAAAIPIEIQFNVVGLGEFVSDTGRVNTANTITDGGPNIVGFVQLNNVGLSAGDTVLLSPDVLGVTLGSVFTKTFTTDLGTFVETLTVTSRTATANALGILATGTIVQTVGEGFDPTPVFWSAAYTQNQGEGEQINGSFNNSTVEPVIRVPEPASLALVGLALAGLGFTRRRRPS